MYKLTELLDYRPIRRYAKRWGLRALKEELKDPTFPIWLSLQMYEKGISQRELARKINMDESTISRLLSGERKPNVTHIQKLSDALNIEAVEIWDVIL